LRLPYADHLLPIERRPGYTVKITDGKSGFLFIDVGQTISLAYRHCGKFDSPPFHNTYYEL
jgi:hypothetical protein